MSNLMKIIVCFLISQNNIDFIIGIIIGKLSENEESNDKCVGCLLVRNSFSYNVAYVWLGIKLSKYLDLESLEDYRYLKCLLRKKCVNDLERNRNDILAASLFSTILTRYCSDEITKAIWNPLKHLVKSRKYLNRLCME